MNYALQASPEQEKYVPTFSYELSFTSNEEIDLSELVSKFKDSFPSLKLRRISNW